MKIFLVSDCPMRKRPLDPIGLPYEMRAAVKAADSAFWRS